jgi:hypothetical protein
VLLDCPAAAAATQLGLGLERDGDSVERYDPQKAPRIAGRALRGVIDAHGARLAEGGAIEVGLFTYPPTGPGASAALLLDWRPLFAPFPVPDQWRDELLPALDDLREALGAAGVTRMRLYPQARNSAALASLQAFHTGGLDAPTLGQPGLTVFREAWARQLVAMGVEEMAPRH